MDNKDTSFSSQSLSFIPLSGIETVTKNMYLYEYGDEILIVDCGLGFPDETMLGVDLLLPDITYLLQTCLPVSKAKKRIVGMVLTHGHEDHIGALPYILPRLPKFPIYASPLTTALSNEKLKEFQLSTQVREVTFHDGPIRLGRFEVDFIRITHSVPDSANIFIKTPVGNFYHTGDYKFDLTPGDGKKTDFQKIAKVAQQGILCLVTDSLGSERQGHTASEDGLSERFEQVMKNTRGKCIITTYSSNITRLNQAIHAAENLGRKVCFVGRSLLKTKAVAQQLGYLQMRDGTEVKLEVANKFDDSKLLLLVAGSQGQENSALSRIVDGEHREIKLTPDDVVIFSSDAIPGNELSVYGVIDGISKVGAKVFYSDITHDFHVSGHGSSLDLILMMSLTRPKYIIPVSSTYRQMVAYQQLAEKAGYPKKHVFVLENGQELIFAKNGVRHGRKIATNNVYVDQVSGEEVENYVLRDREKLAKEGIIIVMVEIAASDGQIVDTPEFVTRGILAQEMQDLKVSVANELKKTLSAKRGRVTNWVNMRNLVGDIATNHIFRKFRRRPLVLPVIIEV